MRGLYLPGHYMPHPGMTDEELLQIAGLSDMTQLQGRAHLIGQDPAALLSEALSRPVPSLGEGYVPDIPLFLGDQQELDACLPLPDFVPLSEPHALFAKRLIAVA